MKQQLNRILSAMLALLLCVSLMTAGAAPAFAAEGTCGENLTWTLENGVLTISGKGAMAKYNEHNMPPWSEMADMIQRIVIQSGVTNVSSMAFYHCTNLTTVTLPDTVTDLGQYAFAGCTALGQISMNGVEKIGTGCFYDCLSLANLILPQTLRSIGGEAFYRCKSLAGITIPAGVGEMGSSVFAYCDRLVYVKIEAPITILPRWTFYGCDLLNELYLPKTVETVETDALSQCPELNYVDFGGSQEVKEEIKEQLAQEPEYRPDEIIHTDVTYDQTEGAVITTTTNTQTGNSDFMPENPSGTEVNATVTDSSGWQDVADSVRDTMDTGVFPSVDVQVQGDVVIPEGALNNIANKDVVVNVHTSDNVDWQVILKDQTADTLKGEQDLSVQLEPNTSDRYSATIGDVTSYLVTLGDTSLNSTILIPLGKESSRQVATLYAINGKKLDKISSVLVDDAGKAAFRVAGTEAGKYILALGVPQIDPQEVLVPEALAPEYGITYGATLTDAYGNQYVLTGRVNKLGFGLGTLTWIIVGVLAGSTIVVGAVMVIWNNQQKKQYAYRNRTRAN